MPQKELDLLQFTSVYVAQLRAGPPKIVRSEVIELNPLGTASNDIPEDILRDRRAAAVLLANHTGVNKHNNVWSFPSRGIKERARAEFSEPLTDVPGDSRQNGPRDRNIGVRSMMMIHDLAGRELLTEIMCGIEGTDFESTQIRALLNPDTLPEDWLVGEVLAQAYLTVHKTGIFPVRTVRTGRIP